MKRWMRAEHVAWRKVGEDTVLIHLREKRMFGLNTAGGLIWHWIDGSRSVPDLLSILVVGPSSPETESSLAGFLDRLAELDLIVEEGEARSPCPIPPRPEGAFEAPEIIWQEKLLKTAQSGCALLPASTPICNAAPAT